MQFHGKPFLLYEPGNISREIADNNRWISIISTVTRLKVVIVSSLGSIRSKGIPYKKYTKHSDPNVQRAPQIKRPKLETEHQQ